MPIYHAEDDAIGATWSEAAVVPPISVGCMCRSKSDGSVKEAKGAPRLLTPARYLTVGVVSKGWTVTRSDKLGLTGTVTGVVETGEITAAVVTVVVREGAVVTVVADALDDSRRAR